MTSLLSRKGIVIASLMPVLMALALNFTSCEAPDSHKPEGKGKDSSGLSSRVTLPTVSYKGMYYLDGTSRLQECSSGRSYLVSEKSEIQQLNQAVETGAAMLRKQRVYIESDGFISTQDNPVTKTTDTVLVITGVSRIDMQFDCLSN